MVTVFAWNSKWHWYFYPPFSSFPSPNGGSRECARKRGKQHLSRGALGPGTSEKYPRTPAGLSGKWKRPFVFFSQKQSVGQCQTPFAWREEALRVHRGVLPQEAYLWSIPARAGSKSHCTQREKKILSPFFPQIVCILPTQQLPHARNGGN